MEIYTIPMAGEAGGNVRVEAKAKGATVGTLWARTLHSPSSFEHYHFLSSSCYYYVLYRSQRASASAELHC